MTPNVSISYTVMSDDEGFGVVQFGGSSTTNGAFKVRRTEGKRWEAEITDRRHNIVDAFEADDVGIALARAVKLVSDLMVMQIDSFNEDRRKAEESMKSFNAVLRTLAGGEAEEAPTVQ